MENWGKGTGNVAVDGAFERFLTAAIATIITIMFSWRLLAEENENFGEIPPGALGRTPALIDGGTKESGEGRRNNQNSKCVENEEKVLDSKYTDQNGLCHFDVDGDDEKPLRGDRSAQPKPSEDDLNWRADYENSWAEYDPDEDMYSSIHTRRSAKDFISENTQPNKERSFSDSDTEISENIVPTSHDFLEQLYVNKEYSSIVDNEGYVDMNDKINNEDSSESESESDEGEYEPPMIDSDEETYYPSVLEPIIEEDSDDSVTVEMETADQKGKTILDRLKQPPTEPSFVSPESVIEVCQGGSHMSKSGSDVLTEADDNIMVEMNHVDLFTSESFHNSSENNQSEYEFQSKQKFKPSSIEISEIDKQNTQDDIEIEDSLPASPIRTCAVDDDKDGYFSDESCSESVVTVVSLKSYERRKMNEDVCLDSHELSPNEMSINSEQLVEACLPSEENINTGGHAPDQIKDDIIAFIHGVENRLPIHSAGQNHGSSNLNAIIDTNSADKNDLDLNLVNNVTETTVTSDNLIEFNHKNQEGTGHLKCVSDKTVETLSKHVGITYNEFVNDLESSSEAIQNSQTDLNELGSSDKDDNLDFVVPDTENNEINEDVSEQEENSQSPLNASIENIEVPDDIYNHFDQSPVEHFGDEGPREYNPEEDDFAHFNSDFDSDEDSFYLLIGGNESLRKLETFTNLNVVGLSPGASSNNETSYIDENEKKIVFSRIEEVVTDHTVKCYVKDRDDPKGYTSDATVDKKDDINNIQEIKLDKSFEEEQQEILKDLKLLLENESESDSVLNALSERVKVDTQIEDIDKVSDTNKIQLDGNSFDQTTNDLNIRVLDIDQIKSATELPSDASCQQVLARPLKSGNAGENENEILKDFVNKDITKEVSELSIISFQQPNIVENQTTVSLFRDLEENKTGFEYSENNSGDLLSEKGILSSIDQTDESLNSSYNEGNSCSERVEHETTYIGKLTHIDNELTIHDNILTLSNNLNCVVQSNIDNNEFTDTYTNSNESELSNPVTLKDPLDHKFQFSSGENSLESSSDNKNEIIDTLSSPNRTSDTISENGHLNENSLNTPLNDQTVEDSSIIVDLEQSIRPCIEILSQAVQTDDKNKNFDLNLEEIHVELENNPSQCAHNGGSISSLNTSQEEPDYENETGNSKNCDSLPTLSRVVHTSAQRPSGYKGVKGKISKQLQYKPKQYTSVLQQPIIVETRKSITLDTPLKSLPKSRQKILVSRKRFLSEENLSTLPSTFKDQFSQHKTSFTKSLPRQRRYVRREGSNSLQARKNLSFDRIDRLRDLCNSPRLLEDSFEKPQIDTLHSDCIFSPHKHEQIMNTTLSIDNLQSHLLRYGSVTSLVETDIDSGETFETRIFPETDIDHDFEFQIPLQRTASMSDIGRKKTGRGRFADRNVTKSKSLQTLETNIDDVFTAEGEGNLTRVPSVHELRVSKSLSKLNVPDWYKKSSVSRSGSTFSLYSSRRDSTSTTSSFGFGHPPSLTTSPCPSVTPGSNAVVIRTRVTPSSARLVRAQKLPTTPEKSPIPPSILKLPSDKFRQKDKPKELMPIPIVPFSKLRLMFESKGKKAQAKKCPDVKSPSSTVSKSTLKSPTSPEVSNLPSQTLPPAEESSIRTHETIVAQTQPTASISPTTPIDSHPKHAESVTNGRIINNTETEHKPPVPEKPKSLLVNKSLQKSKESAFREHNSKHVRYSIPSQSLHSPVQNEQVHKRLAPPAIMVESQSQSRKGKVYDFNDNLTSQSRENSYANLHGELLFDFLQRLRYSRLQENVFTDQLPSDMDSENNGQHYRFPILSVNQHSPGFDQSYEDLADTGNLQVVFADSSLNGGNDGVNLTETSLEEVLSGLLALNEKKKSSTTNSEDEIVSRKISDESQVSLSPPWCSEPFYTSVSSDSDRSAMVDNLSYYDNVFEDDDSVMVRCKNCRRESPLKYARNNYKTCHHCFTYYCSRHCRKVNWEIHKGQCLLSMINSLCKRVVKFVNRDSDAQYQFSRAARRGYLSQGRGCLVLAFSDLECAENFLVQGVHSLWLPPVFLSVNNLYDAHMLQESVQSLVEMCTSFNPELKYVLHVVITVPGNLPQKPLPRKTMPLVQKTAKLRLSPAHMHPEFKESEESSTLILTAIPGGPDVNSSTERKSREVCFVNIQRKLRERGVSLRHHYPNVYDKLIEYVADARHFTPLIIYPYDNRTGKRFMCVIMPESEPEIEWVQERTLLGELDITEDFCREGIYSISLSSLEDIPETPV